MNSTLEKIKAFVASSDVHISDHGYDELAADNIAVRDVVIGLDNAIVIEEYPDFRKGPCILVLESDRGGNPFHAVWGLPAGTLSPAVLITAYRPDPSRWSKDFRSRKK
jgi:hypothetical protein